jgi:hypothetical protein
VRYPRQRGSFELPRAPPALGEAAGWGAPDGAARSSLAADAATYRQEIDALRTRGFVTEAGDRVRAFAFLAWFAVRLRQKSEATRSWDEWIREEGWERFWSRARGDAWNRAAFPRAMGIHTDIESLLLAHASRLSPARPASLPGPSEVALFAAPPAAMTVREPIDVFLSYAHADEALCNELSTHLAVLVWNGDVRLWHDRQIGAGEDWKGAIDAHLEAAHRSVAVSVAVFRDRSDPWPWPWPYSVAVPIRGRVRGRIP